MSICFEGNNIYFSVPAPFLKMIRKSDVVLPKKRAAITQTHKINKGR
jgi:hypothetical protein